MGQIAIVRKGTECFREYEIEPGDSLIGICSRFGHLDWRAVYEHSANAPFRVRFPDPHQIDFVTSVNLLIPLAGTVKGGSFRGSPLADYFVAKLTNQVGVPLNKVDFYLTGPGISLSGKKVTTSSLGEVIVTNPKSGDYALSSPDYQLLSVGLGALPLPVRELDTLDRVGQLLHPTNDFKLNRNAVTEIVVRRVSYIICPMCGITFQVPEKQVMGPDYLCPKDAFNLTRVQKSLLEDVDSFLSPATGQKPMATPATLKCRGLKAGIGTVHGPILIYWDESRFVSPEQGDYHIWGEVDGVPRSVKIIGRATWGAGPPIMGEGLVYEFQKTARNASPAYETPIPSNETLQLSSVLRWMTIHHTADPAENSFVTVTKLQHQHQTKGEEGEAYADIGYQYVIDANGSIYEGRPLGIKGSHVLLFNGGNIGIALAGDFESRWENGFSPDIPTLVALSSLFDLVDVIAARFGVKSVWSHRKRAPQAGLASDYTECPGDELQDYVEGPLRSKYATPK